MALSTKRPSEKKEMSSLQKIAKEQESPTVRLSIEIDRETHKRLKILATEQYTTISKVVRDMVEKELEGK